MSYVKVMIHAVWGTKNREHYIAKDVRPLLLTHIKEKCLLLQSKNLSMSTSTSFMATCTCAAPERGRGLQGWAAFIQQMEVESETRNVVKSNLEGVEIRPVGAYNNIFCEHINEFCLMLRKPTADQMTGKVIKYVNEYKVSE